MKKNVSRDGFWPMIEKSLHKTEIMHSSKSVIADQILNVQRWFDKILAEKFQHSQ